MKSSRNTVAWAVLAISLVSGFNAWNRGSAWREELASAKQELETASNSARLSTEAADAITGLAKAPGGIEVSDHAITSAIMHINRAALNNGVVVGAFSVSGGRDGVVSAAQMSSPLQMTDSKIKKTPMTLKTTYNTYEGLRNFLASLALQPIAIKKARIANNTMDIDLEIYSLGDGQS